MRKFVFGLILAVAVSTLLYPAAAQASTATDEAAFVAKINELRASKGLGPLQVNANLVAKARAWSAGMAAANRIWHSTLSDGVTEDWKKLGENVGMGGSVDGLHRAFVNSPHHYENLVDPAFGQVGIGIVMGGDTIFVTQVFMQLMPGATVGSGRHSDDAGHLAQAHHDDDAQARGACAEARSEASSSWRPSRPRPPARPRRRPRLRHPWPMRRPRPRLSRWPPLPSTSPGPLRLCSFRCSSACGHSIRNARRGRHGR